MTVERSRQNTTLLQDLSDIQWRGFREGLPQAAAAMAVFAAGSQAVRTALLSSSNLRPPMVWLCKPCE